MIRPTDGTPFPFTTKSMYGPGGAVGRLDAKHRGVAAGVHEEQ